jgi:PKD repeat protein
LYRPLWPFSNHHRDAYKEIVYEVIGGNRPVFYHNSLIPGYLYKRTWLVSALPKEEFVMKHLRIFQQNTKWLLLLVTALLVAGLVSSLPPTATAAISSSSIILPEDGAILYGDVLLQANAASDVGIVSVEFFYRAHEDAAPSSLGFGVFNPVSGFWELPWDTTTFVDTYNNIDTNGDGVDDTTVNLTKPPTNDDLSIVVTETGGATAGHTINVRIQNMLTARIFLPDNQEDIRGFEDLEVLTTGEFAVTSVRFDLYDIYDADPRILTPFGEFDSFGEPVENPHYGRPLGDPAFPTGGPIYPIGAATLEGAKRWVYRNWDTTPIPDGTYLLVATAEDTAGRTATYMVETYIVNDLRVVITAPEDGATVSRFVALEARTSSMTGADNAAPGSLWPATAVDFTIGSTTIPATETPIGSGRWRAIWNGDAFTPGPYTITATATNANPNGSEVAVDSINVELVAAGAALEAYFPFDWGNCNLLDCAFLDGSGGAPTSWAWDFDGDGVVDSTDQLPTYTYSAPGVYVVTLTVSNDGGTTTDSYSRSIPVGNTGVVSFNRNGINDATTEFIDWTSAFKSFNYTVGDTLVIPVIWKTTTGPTGFISMPDEVCTDETTPRPCVLFTPEEAYGTPPYNITPADDGVLFSMEFTDVQYRGTTDIFKGKVNLRISVAVDSGDGNPDLDWTAQLGTNVDVTNTDSDVAEVKLVAITSPFEGQYVGGFVPVTASVVSVVTADEVEFFVGATSIGTDEDGSNGWAVSWDTTEFVDGAYELTAVATFGSETTTSAVRTVNVENTLPTEPDAPAGTFQTGRATDTLNQFITFPFELEEEGGGGPPGGRQPTFDTSMTATFSNIVVIPGGGAIGGDALEFDITITNTSSDPGAVLTAYAFQSKVSESPALGSRVGDKAFYAFAVPGPNSTVGPIGTVKKNGTSNGLLPGQWKGICINSSTDFIPEFNSGLESESLECGGNRTDTNFDGEPELQVPPVGLYPGQSQTVRLRIEAGTTDGALHVVEAGTLRGAVAGVPIVGPNSVTYYDVALDNDRSIYNAGRVPEDQLAAIVDPNVVAVVEFGDNKVLRDADGTFNPTFAPFADGLTFDEQKYLTLPRRNFAFSDILGRNHTCATYGLTLGKCDPGHPDYNGGQPFLHFLDVGDLIPGVPNFAAILHGFGEYVEVAPGEYEQPMFPYGVECENCGGKPYVPIAEFYKDNGDGTITQQMVAGTYGALGTSDQYTSFIASATAEDFKEEVIPELDPGGPCDPVADPDSRKPSCAQLRTSATGHFYGLTVVPGAGINGGDAIEFYIDITNTSVNPEAYLTAFNYQTKRRGLADIGILDGYTQDRKDVRVDPTLPPCTSLDDGACFNASLGVGHFPNVIGNGLLFGQMVWTDATAGREPDPVSSDQVHVNSAGIDPVPYWLESVKKNGPFSPILKGNTNFICVKSGLFDLDPDSDASCGGEPALLVNPDLPPIPSNFDTSQLGNPSGRLGLPPGATQTVRIRMEFGDFRGALLEIVAGTLTSANVDERYGPDGTNTNGLARFFDCSDQRELEFCHPDKVGDNIGYLPNTDATWLTPTTLEEIEYVIINQPGDAPTVMNFQDNLGYILAMAGFVPSAEFYAPDPNPDLIGTPYEGVLIRQQVLGIYAITEVPASPTMITSTPITDGQAGVLYNYQVIATAYPGPMSYSLLTAPDGMTIESSTGLISWTPTTDGAYDVTIQASNGVSEAVQTYTLTVGTSSTSATLTIVKIANPVAPWLDFNFTGSGSIGDFVLDNDASSATPDRMTFEVDPGSYTVAETNKPGNWDLSVICSGASFTASGTSVTVELVAGAEAECVFHNQRQPQIRITKYEDVNANSNHDSSEPGLEGWQMFLYRDDGNGGWTQIQVNQIKLTNASGMANYTGLIPGVNHLVCEEDRSGWTNTAPGGTIYHDGRICQVVANLVYGEVRDVNFGNYNGLLVLLSLVDELGSPLANYPVDYPAEPRNLRYRYRCGGSWAPWIAFQTNANGQFFAKPDCSAYNKKYWDGRITVNLNQTTLQQFVAENATFQAAKVVAELRDHAGALLAGGVVEQGGGYWYTHGTTDNGPVAFYAFPGSVRVRMTYNNVRENRNGIPITVGVNTVTWYTGQVTVTASCTNGVQVKQGGQWFTYAPGSVFQLLPGSYNYRGCGRATLTVTAQGTATIP